MTIDRRSLVLVALLVAPPSILVAQRSASLASAEAEAGLAIAQLSQRAATLSSSVAALGTRSGTLAARLRELELLAATRVRSFDRLETVPPPADGDQDPADSTYREARTMLNRGNYTRAAYLFEQIGERYPRSTYAADSYYWGAYALSRAGSESSLNRALRLLEAQQDRFPNASTRRSADELSQRIRGELARQGDAEAARSIRERAEELAESRRDREEMERDRAREARESARAGRQSRRSGCDEDDERMAALNALLQMDSDRALPILERVMEKRDAASACVRRRAVFMVSQQSGPRAERILLAAVRSDPDQEVREQAVFWLSQVSGDGAVTALDSILRSSNDRTIQEKAIFALSQHQSERAARALRDFASRRDAPGSLRENAIFWLGQSGGDNAEFLRSLYRTVDERPLKEKIIFAIAQNGQHDGFRWLLEVAGNTREDIELRKKAVFWAAQSGADLPELFALYDRAGDRELKEQLIFAYSQSNKRAAVDKLIEIARRDADRELRKKALFWLSQSNDPRVVELLTEILEKPQ